MGEFKRRRRLCGDAMAELMWSQFQSAQSTSVPGAACDVVRPHDVSVREASALAKQTLASPCLRL